MFLQARSPKDEFNVESIMRCEEFKSNFARRLSNRYTTKSPATLKQDSALKLLPSEIDEQKSVNISPKTERNANIYELLKNIKVEHNGEVVKPPEKKATKTDQIRTAEVSALNMEVETLRWQLSQTEANRQMHLALLKQIVSLLNRVKEHMVCQTQEANSAKELVASRRPAAELPRSRSVLTVNKNLEYTLTPNKKLSTRKISKSISNVNGLKDCGMTWNDSKISLNQETYTANKLAEEISRLITLANTVLSTKLPDLSCCSGMETNVDNIKLEVLPDSTDDTEDPMNSDSNKSSDLNKMDQEPARQLSFESANIYEEVADILPPGPNGFVSTTSISCCGLEKERSPLSIRSMNGASRMPKVIAEKPDFTHVTNFIEDESGFSSMSSFQDIGIPIINIIPPTPCKEVTYPLGDLDIQDIRETWKATLDLDKQTVQVFWV